MKNSVLWMAHWALTFTCIFAHPDSLTASVPALAKKDTISDILTDIEDAASCTACEVRAIAVKSK